MANNSNGCGTCGKGLPSSTQAQIPAPTVQAPNQIVAANSWLNAGKKITVRKNKI